MNENKAIFSEEFKSAVITVLTAFRDDLQNNPLMQDIYKDYTVQRIEKAIKSFDKGFITAREALETGIDPFKYVTDKHGNVSIEACKRFCDKAR